MADKKVKYIALYKDSNGKLLQAERTSARRYAYASVVRWSDEKISVGVKWSATESGARNCLTKDQRANGAQVIAVVPVHLQTVDLTPFARKLGELLSVPGDS